MKKSAFLILSLLLILNISFIYAEGSNWEQIVFEKEENHIKAWNHAHQIAKEIEEDYGIIVLIQEECDEVGIDAPFSFVHDIDLNSSTLDRAMGYDHLPDYLSFIQETLSIYPKDMFDPFRKYGGNLRILLVNAIREDDIQYYPSGVTISQDGWYNIYVGLVRFDIITFQHELWHAFEHRIKDEFPDTFNNWSIFNPEGFQYLNKDYDNDSKPEVDPSLLLPAKTAWFARNYSITNEQEDRATIYEMLFYEEISSIDQWKQYPHLYDKIIKMSKELNRVFTYEIIH